MGAYKYSETFLKKTIAFWQPRSPQPLTLQDAEEIITNTVELIKHLNLLDKKYTEPEKKGASKLP